MEKEPFKKISPEEDIGSKNNLENLSENKYDERKRLLFEIGAGLTSCFDNLQRLDELTKITEKVVQDFQITREEMQESSIIQQAAIKLIESQPNLSTEVVPRSEVTFSQRGDSPKLYFGVENFDKAISTINSIKNTYAVRDEDFMAAVKNRYQQSSESWKKALVKEYPWVIDME